MCVCSRAVRGTTGGVSLKSEQEDRKKTSPFDFFVTMMISLVPFLLSSSSSKVSRGHMYRYAIGTKYGKMKKIDGWDTKAWKILSFFLSVPNGVEHEKKSRESKHIELRQAQNARFSPPASGAVEKKEHGRRYQNDASRRRRREEWKN